MGLGRGPTGGAVGFEPDASESKIKRKNSEELVG